MLLSQEIERIEKGEPVCLNAVAEAWAERRVKEGHASYLEVHSLANQLSNELQLAVRSGQLYVFDTFRKRERPYRHEDEKDLASGHVWLMVQSVDVWLLREGFPPALTKTALPTRPSAIANGSNVQLETQALPGPLFWNPLPEAAAWLASELGTPMDARALTDEIIRMGKPGTPMPTIIKAVMPRDSRFCLVAMPGHLERCEFLDGPQHARLTKAFGPLSGGLAYIQEVRLDVIALGVNHLLELMLRGQTEVSMEFTSRGDECVFLMPFNGDPHIATIETCGINQQDLLILRASLACEAKPATPAPVVIDSASSAPGNGKVWTPEKLAEVKAYREKHGTKKAAEHFKISTSLIRQKLPSAKPKPKGYSAFTHRS